MTFRDLKLRIRALLTPRRTERELDDELAFHIERETHELLRSGIPLDEARTRARARFGSVALAADRCRDARGTNLIDNTVRDILYALRSFARAPLAALTIVATVSLGLGLVAVVFTLFNAFFYRVDAVREPDELFAVMRLPHARVAVWDPFTRPEYEAMRHETSVFAGAFGVVRGISTRIDGRTMNCTLVTGNFFEVLGVTAALGRTLTPADDQHGARPVIVLSEPAWRRLFAQDPTVIGRSVLVNGVPTEIVGVMREGFRGLGLGAPEYWAPLALAGQFRRTFAGREDQMPITVVARLKSGSSPETATSALSAWASARSGQPAFFRLKPSRGTIADDADEALIVFSPVFFAFGLVLLIGCANVANLLLARGLSRQREIGIRLSLGASRPRVVRQLLTESLILALAAAACALAVSRVLLAAAIQVVTATMPAEMAEHFHFDLPPADWRVLAFLAGGALISTAFFGLVPALHATRLELIRTMRGELTRDARPGRARSILIGLQVTASALLLICAGVFLRSAFTISSVDPGVRTSDTLVIEIENEPVRPALLEAVGHEGVIVAMAASAPHALAVSRTALADAPATSVRLGAGYRFVSADYFDVLGIRMLKGRPFTAAERTVDAGVAIVSETAARRLWPDRDAVGQIVRLDTVRLPNMRRDIQPLPRAATVVGVVRDVKEGRLTVSAPGPLVYLPTSPEMAATDLTLRVRADPEQARQVLTERLMRIDPALGTIMTMRTMAGLEVYILRVAFWVTVVLGCLALAFTLSGLFSVLSYIVEQRAKEIGVRMAVGATTRDIALLVLSQSFRPVTAGLLAGAGLAAAVATVLLTLPDAAYFAGLVRVLDPVAYSSSVFCVSVACLLAALVPALRAARIDPIATLRQD